MANNWVRYFNRSYEQIKAEILTTRLPAAVPEITDLNESNLFVKFVSIWSGVADMLGYYIDNHARETHLLTCRLWESGVKIAHAHDYRIKARRAATVDILFTLSSPALVPVIIPIGTVVKTASGIKFFTVNSATISVGHTAILIGAEERTGYYSGVALGTGDSTLNQSYPIPHKDYTDNSVALTVDASVWGKEETLGFSDGNSPVFTQSVDSDGYPVVMFGDGFTGAIPASGDAIVCTYRTCSGDIGNVPAGTITTIDTAITLPTGITITATNPERSSGGASVEGLEDLRYRIPRATRTLLRAVNEQDYVDLAELANGVARAGVKYDCGKEILLYIVPEGGGVATSPLLASVAAWMDDKRMITTRVTVLPAGEVHILITVDVRVLPAYSNLDTANTLKTALAEFLSYKFQRIGGMVQLSDIYQTIENTAGVDYSNVTGMVTVPYATRTYATVTPLAWSRATLPGSVSVVHWDLNMINPTQYQLFREGNYVGTYSVGSTNTQTEITFTVASGGYIMGDSWAFVTYPYTGSIQLDEPSLPVALTTDITINATGGI